MTAVKKLDEAQFYLEKLSSVAPSSDEFKYFTSACVWAINGAFDHLLYDYAKKYWPRLDQTDFIDQRAFRLCAKATNNADAKRFIDWYGEASGRIASDGDATIVLAMRRIEAHRGEPIYNYFGFLSHYASNVSGSITVRSSTFQRAPDLPPELTPYFEDHYDRAIYEVVANTIRLIRQIVSEAESQFGSP